MSRMLRSPPTAAANNNNLMQVSSDSDIPQSVSSSPFEKVNTSTRHKRPREEFSPTNELQDFKHQILQMLTQWKNEQETQLKRFLEDQTLSMSKLVTEIADLKSHISAIQKTNAEIEKSVGFMSQKYDDVMIQIEILQKEKQAYKHTTQTFETKILDLQLSTRSSTVKIRNVPSVKEKESTADLANIVSKVGATVNVPINTTHIRDIYRLPGKPGSTRPIVTEFTSVQTKLQLLTSVRDFNKNLNKEDRLSTLSIGINGSRHPVYVAEYLPPSVRKLFFATRQYAKLKEFKFCWTNNENVFLRKSEGDKQILIRSEQTLRDLEEKQ